MDVSSRRKTINLFMAFVLALLGGCGSSGGGNDENQPPANGGADPDPVEAGDPFQVNSYHEASSINQSLSGIWLMVASHKTHEYYARLLETTDTTHRSRQLLMLIDVDRLPNGGPTLSTCSYNETLGVSGNHFSFGKSDWRYSATIESNTRISGSYQDSYAAPWETTEATFTLIKIAALPNDLPVDDLPVDSSSDGYFDSYMAKLESPTFGTVSVKADKTGSLKQGTGSVTCFSHSAETYAISTPTSSKNGQTTKFWAGRPEHTSLKVERRTQQSRADEWFLGIRTPDSPFISAGNELDSDAPGLFELSLQGGRKTSAEASAQGTEEGNLSGSATIELP